jgi:hypothetical protein
MPHDISLSPPLTYYHIDLFISFKLIFVKGFLADITTLGHGRGDDDEKDPDRHEL